ncbi:MAG: phosphoserine transaminase [Neomegalonema sp.]|nr:phosphoserine transaminase [Neomegalonema sp.]
MTTLEAAVKPSAKPAQPSFSSGPCPKRPGWSIDQVVSRAYLGRSHRAKQPKAQLKEAIEKTRDILGIPADYKIGIVPASDTGAVEMAMWSMLGARPVDMLAWESFGAGWVTDAVKQLKLADCRVIEAGYGALPDLASVRDDADLVFTWNGTTSGARVANADWIKDNPERIVICDATSAAFAQDLDWAKLDVTTFSWQKVMGGEAAHGMLILSPRAVARLESYAPDRPLPKIFRLTKKGALNADIFEGATINTPSMLCVADYIDGLDWAAAEGGLTAMMARADANTAALQAWIDASDWAENLVAEPSHRSNTSVCLKVVDPAITALDEKGQQAFAKKIVSLLDAEGAAYDIGGYRDAPAGLRIWCGATVEKADVEALTPWLDWAFAQAKAAL